MLSGTGSTFEIGLCEKQNHSKNFSHVLWTWYSWNLYCDIYEPFSAVGLAWLGLALYFAKMWKGYQALYKIAFTLFSISTGSNV